jgi:hypothetical protein
MPSLKPSQLIMSLDDEYDNTACRPIYQSIGATTALNGNIQATIRWMVVANRVARDCGGLQTLSLSSAWRGFMWKPHTHERR